MIEYLSFNALYNLKCFSFESSVDIAPFGIEVVHQVECKVQ